MTFQSPFLVYILFGFNICCNVCMLPWYKCWLEIFNAYLIFFFLPVIGTWSWKSVPRVLDSLLTTWLRAGTLPTEWKGEARRVPGRLAAPKRFRPCRPAHQALSPPWVLPWPHSARWQPLQRPCLHSRGAPGGPRAPRRRRATPASPLGSGAENRWFRC